MQQQSSFYITLPSNSSNALFKNRPENYKVQLARPLELDGKWELALTEIQYPSSWNNINEDCEFRMDISMLSSITSASDKILPDDEMNIMLDDKEPSTLKINCGIRKGNYTSITALCNSINDTIEKAFVTEFKGKKGWRISKFRPVKFEFNNQTNWLKLLLLFRTFTSRQPKE